MAKKPGVVFREVPWDTQQRGLVLAATGIGGKRADAQDVLRLALALGLLALEELGKPGGADPAVVRLARTAGASIGSELVDVPADAPTGVLAVATELRAQGVPAGTLKAADSADLRYAEAYTLGIKAATPGGAWTLAPRDARSIGATIGPALRVHASVNGTPITGDDLIAWIRREAEAFRRATEHEPQYWSAWSPRAFAQWLNVRTSTTRKGTAQPAARAKFGKEAAR